MARLIRAKDWTRTTLGPIDLWPESLLCAVNLILASPLAMSVSWGPELIQLYNDAYLGLIAEKHPTALGQPAAECWREAWHHAGPQMEAAYFSGTSTHRENVLVPVIRNGRLQDVYWTYGCSPITNGSGQITGVLTVVYDVTSEVLLRDERDTLSSQLNQVLDATPEGIVFIDRSWRFTYANPSARGMLSASADLIGKNIWQTFPEMDAPGSPFMHFFFGAMDRNLDGDFQAYYPEPLNIWVRVHVTPAPDGIVAFFRDVTRERTNESHARDTTARLDAMYNTSLEYIGLLSPDGTLLEANHASLEFAGSLRDEVIGLPLWETPWFIYTPGAPELLREAIARAARGEHIRYEAPLTRPSGDTIVFDFSLSPVCDKDGKVVFIVPEGRDITTLKRAESALKETEKLAVAGRLAASIAHEINNPLESVTNLLYLALNTEHDVPQIHQYLTLAERELRRVSSITSQTLRFYRQSTLPKAVSPGELVESALSIHQGRFFSPRIDVRTRFRASHPVQCFEGEIRQVLNNLIGNAIDAMNITGGRLLARTRDATHWPTGRRGVVITVADTGCGIAPRHIARIFEPFFTTKGIRGTGLGLWISQEIIDRHDGKLRIRSSTAPGRSGTVFALFLPYDAVALLPPELTAQAVH